MTDSPLTSQASPQSIRVPLPQSTPYVTYAIIGITVFFYILQLISIALFGRFSGGIDLLQIYGSMIGSAVRAGEIWRLITPVLLHDNQSLLHIGFNMYGLYIFGRLLERFLGHKRFLLLYLVGGFSGNALSFFFSSPNTYGVGASTAVFGLVAAEAIFFYQNRKLFADQFKRVLGNAIFIVAANLLIGSSIGADNFGHLGGLLGGLMFTFLAGPLWEVESNPAGGYRIVDRRPGREIIIGALAVLVIFGALAVWGMMR